MTKLHPSFYQDEDVLGIAQALLGKMLCTCIDGNRVGGLITETESYAGITDRASHAYGGRRTRRTEVMYSLGGVAYVYLCYGMHSLLNVVTAKEGVPHAVLIRAMQPVLGVEIMEKRRANKRPLAEGPGTLAQALGVTCAHSGLDLQSDILWIADVGIDVLEKEICAGPRVGVEYAGPDAALPYRFQWVEPRQKLGSPDTHTKPSLNHLRALPSQIACPDRQPTTSPKSK